MPDPRHKWDVAERHLLHIARTETNLSPSDLERVFAQIFSTGFWPDGLPNATRLTDEYNCRYNSGRSQDWAKHVERTSYDQTQQRDRQEARDRIRTAATTLGIHVRWAPLPQGSAPVPSVPAPPVPAPTASVNRPQRLPAASTSSRATPVKSNKRNRGDSDSGRWHTIFEGGPGERKKAKNTATPAHSTRAGAQGDRQVEEDQDEAATSSEQQTLVRALNSTNTNININAGESRSLQPSAAEGRQQATPSRSTKPVRRTRSSAAYFKENSDDEEHETADFVQPKVHNGPTFEQIYEQQRRTNALHPAYRWHHNNLNDTPVEWQNRLASALNGCKVLEAEIQRRLGQESTGTGGNEERMAAEADRAKAVGEEFEEFD